MEKNPPSNTKIKTKIFPEFLSKVSWDGKFLVEINLYFTDVVYTTAWLFNFKSKFQSESDDINEWIKVEMILLIHRMFNKQISYFYLLRMNVKVKKVMSVKWKNGSNSE